MKLNILGLSVVTAVLSGCVVEPARRPEFSAGYPVYDCPPNLENQVRLSAEVFPLQGDVPARDYGVRTVGAVGRRLVLGVEPAGLGRDDRIVWSSVAISSYGGTFVNWSRLQAGQLVLDPNLHGTQASDTRSDEGKSSTEVATVRSSPGQIRITRSARRDTDLAGIHSIDMSIMPGGVVVDDTVLASMRLWNADGSPLPPSDARFELAPVRHPPGLDVVQAALQLDFVVRLGDSGEEWACSAEARATLVDQDSIRQAFWDLGLASKNAARHERLALFNAEVGAIRLTFDSPAAANSFANWLQLSRATAVSGYSIGAFTQREMRPNRPFGPVDSETMKTFRPLQLNEFAAIKVGPVGEP